MKRKLYRMFCAMLSALLLVFTPVSDVLSIPNGRIESHAFAVAIPVGISAVEVLGSLLLSFAAAAGIYSVADPDAFRDEYLESLRAGNVTYDKDGNAVFGNTALKDISPDVDEAISLYVISGGKPDKEPDNDIEIYPGAEVLISQWLLEDMRRFTDQYIEESTSADVPGFDTGALELLPHESFLLGSGVDPVEFARSVVAHYNYSSLESFDRRVAAHDFGPDAGVAFYLSSVQTSYEYYVTPQLYIFRASNGLDFDSVHYEIIRPNPSALPDDYYLSLLREDGSRASISWTSFTPSTIPNVSYGHYGTGISFNSRLSKAILIPPSDMRFVVPLAPKFNFDGAFPLEIPQLGEGTRFVVPNLDEFDHNIKTAGQEELREYITPLFPGLSPDPAPAPDPLPDPLPDPAPGPDIAPGPGEEDSPIYPGVDLGPLLDFLRGILQKILDAILALAGLLGLVGLVTDIYNWLRAHVDLTGIQTVLSNIAGFVSSIPSHLTNILDAVRAVPGIIVDFFTIDMAAVTASFAGLKSALVSRFDAVTAISDVFTGISFSGDETIPVMTMRVPDTIADVIGQNEIIVFDLRGYEDYCRFFRNAFRCFLWIGFAFAIMKMFDVEFHVG